MTDKNYNILLAELRKEAEQAKHNTKEQAIEVLHRIGICTKNGKLKDVYKATH